METTFRLSYVPSSDGTPPDCAELFGEMAEILCRECGGSCGGFFLAEELKNYEAWPGPKIGWVIDGKIILLRMANCRQLNRMSDIAQMLHHFGMNVLESKLIQ